jgi:AraC-like DNA-binding protein
MDALSEVLKVVKLESAFFHNAEFSAPYSYSSPEASRLAPCITQPPGHVIIYHLLIEGRAFVRTDSERIALVPGDIIIFPHGHAHCLESGDSCPTFDGEEYLRQILRQGLTVSHLGGGGATAHFICGYMACDPDLSKVFLSGLPPVFKVNIREDDSGKWLENSIRFSVLQAHSPDAGSDAVLAKLCETLFVETLRRYISKQPERQSGWLAAALDREVGKALALIHSRPADPWTIATLAHEVGLSRSVLAERFRQFLGHPPVAYLTEWRLQMGAQMLGSTSYSIAQIASEVGYNSEQAFNRAFKRKFGHPPARYRVEAKAVASAK